MTQMQTHRQLQRQEKERLGMKGTSNERQREWNGGKGREEKGREGTNERGRAKRMKAVGDAGGFCKHGAHDSSALVPAGLQITVSAPIRLPQSQKLAFGVPEAGGGQTCECCTAATSGSRSIPISEAARNQVIESETKSLRLGGRAHLLIPKPALRSVGSRVAIGRAARPKTGNNTCLCRPCCGGGMGLPSSYKDSRCPACKGGEGCTALNLPAAYHLVLHGQMFQRVSVRPR
ncbi:hypothetical protein B0T21DRAFT_348969 [Apiosordaria backusii]|uniref:Uncharacterized protein n=1 Tax=Apiosordaria backusii TaxID=314023 RepID=A0AA40EFC1_9PEZI|nr:hypothetical protein B0T21DRAFT_348969 [Apiosordaria backusii]